MGGGLRDGVETTHHVCQAEDPVLHCPYTRDPLKISGPHVRKKTREWKEEDMFERDFGSKNDRT